jgi:hypothetical protein
LWHARVVKFNCTNRPDLWGQWVTVDFDVSVEEENFDVLIGEDGWSPEFTHTWAWAPQSYSVTLEGHTLDGGELVARAIFELTNPDEPDPDCSITPTLNTAPNVFDFAVACTGVSDGFYPFVFSLEHPEEGEFDVEIVDGAASFAHAFGYDPVGVVTHTQELTVGSEVFNSVVTIDETPDPPALEVTAVQDFNHVDFSITWSGGNPDGQYEFLFGDETSSILSGPSGEVVLPHDYAYELGGVVTYTATVTVMGPGGEATWSDEVVVDDRSLGPCALDYEVINPPNTVKVTGNCENTKDGYHKLSWGDGSSTFALIENGKLAGEEHSYQYTPGGKSVYEATLYANNTDVVLGTLEVIIDDTPLAGMELQFLPLIMKP